MGAISAHVPEAAFIPLPESELGSSMSRVSEAINAKLSRSKAAVVGPGLGEDDYADALDADVVWSAGGRGEEEDWDSDRSAQ